MPGPSAGTAFVNFQGDFSQLSTQMAAQLAPRRFNKLGRGAGLALTAGIVAGTAALGKSVSLAVDFEKKMRNVNSIAKLSEKQFQSLNKEVLALAGPTAQSPLTLAEAMYTLVSSGFDANEAMIVLEKSARAATAGLTDTETATSAVAATLNAYRLPAQKAGFVSDVLFRTVDRGVITFEALASTIGQTLPIAAALEIDITQVGAAFATLTKQGLSGAEASTRVRAIMTQMVKPTEGLEKAMRKLGVETIEELIQKSGGFQGALEALIGTTDGTKQGIAELFTNQRALIGAMALTGKNSRAARKDLKDMGDSAGATAAVFAEQSKSVAVQWQRFTAELEASAIIVGTKLIPVLTKAIVVFRALGEAIGFAFSSITNFITVVSGAFLARALLRAFTASAVFNVMGVAGVLLGQRLMLAMGGSIGVAAAALGIANILSSVLEGDFKEAGFKSGGALAGGIIGSFTPLGPVIGAALGTVIGGALEEPITNLWESIFGGGEEAVKGMKKALKESAEELADTQNRAAQANKRFGESARFVREAHQRQRRTSREVREAEQDLLRVRDTYGPRSREAIRAEARLANAKAKDAQATKAARVADRAHGVERRALMNSLRALNKSELVRIATLKGQSDTLLQQVANARKNNLSNKETIRLYGRWRDVTGRLRKVQAEHGKTLQTAAQRIGPGFAKALERVTKAQAQFGKITKNDVAAIFPNLNKQTKRLAGSTDLLGLAFRDAGTKVKKGNDKMGKSMNSLDKAVYGAEENIRKNTNKSLGAFGAKRLRFSLGKPKLSGQQMGGETVPGSGIGDKIMMQALVEPGERVFVLNRNASSYLGALQALNSSVPRFQTGGLQPGISKLARILDTRFGMTISSGLRAGDSDSLHSTGQAADFSGGNFPGASRYVAAQYRQLLEGIYNPASLGGVPVSVDQFRRVPTSFWGGATWGAHADHIHAAVPGAGGAFASALFQLARPIINGPAGPLRSMGQGASDTAWRAAKKLLGRQTGTFGAEPIAGMLSKGSIARLWRSVNPGLGSANLMAAIAMAESGGNPNAINSIGAKGLYQIIPSTASAFGLRYGRLFNAAYNTLGAGRILRGQGLGAWEAYTNGMYRQYLQRGGLVRLQGGGGLFGERGKTGAGERERILGSNKFEFSTFADTFRLPSRFNRRINMFTGNADTFADYAGRAEQLTRETPTGQVIQGIVKAHDQLYWLRQELRAVWFLRNTLVNAINFIERLRERIRKILAAGRILFGGGRKGPKITKGQRKTLEGRSRELGSTKRDLMSTLTDVQGLGSNTKWMKRLPKTAGIFGGRIFDVQMAIAGLLAPAEAVDDETTGITSEQLASIAALKSLGVIFKESDFSGVFAKGGWIPSGKWGIAGEAGPEIVSGPAGVTPMGGGVEVNIQVPDALAWLKDQIRVEVRNKDTSDHGHYRARRTG